MIAAVELGTYSFLLEKSCCLLRGYSLHKMHLIHKACLGPRVPRTTPILDHLVTNHQSYHLPEFYCFISMTTGLLVVVHLNCYVTIN